MPRRYRAATRGLIFHVVNRSAKRVRLFETSDDYAAFVAILREGVARFRIAIFAYCVMPNHWHLVISPSIDGELSRFMHWLTTTHARRWQLAHGLDGQGAVYQGRFRAIPIAEDRHFLWVCRYVERNALRAALVDRAEDWRWCSLSSQPTWISEWPLARPLSWIEHVNMPQTPAELLAFRKSMTSNKPFGDDAWSNVVISRLGLKRRKPRGRPRRRATVL